MYVNSVYLNENLKREFYAEGINQNCEKQKTGKDAGCGC